jgi:hypothetical protein
MNVLSYGSIVVLAGIYALQFFNKGILKKYIKFIALGVFLLAVGYWTYISMLQYQAFEAGPLSTTLHTVQGVKWFVGYVRLHYWNTHLVSLVFSIALIAVAEYFHKRRGRVFFEDEELYIAAIGIFLVGWPGILGYVPAMLLVPAIASALFLRRGERLPLYYFWMPLAMAVILTIAFWGIYQPWWGYFRF